jgi:hypothetical protein
MESSYVVEKSWRILRNALNAVKVRLKKNLKSLLSTLDTME